VVETDYSAESGARMTRKLLSSPNAPTAIVFDSDILAVTGLGVAQQMGFTVPDDLSIIGWDDSLISQVVHPPLTAITRDIEAFGIAAARHLLAALNGEATTDVETVRGELTPRGSTARPVAVR
jgi:DNA-binding LacI/PurR family transcriptional regulator